MLSYCRPGVAEGRTYENQFEDELKAATVVRYELAAMQNALGECYIYDGNIGKALPHLQAAYDAVVDGDGEGATLRAEVTIRLSIVLIGLAQHGAARQLLERERETVLLGMQQQPRLGSRLELAMGLLVEGEGGSAHEAIPHYTSAIDKLRDCLGEEDPEQIWPELALVEAELRAGQTEMARRDLVIAKSIVTKYYDPSSNVSVRVSEFATQLHLI